MKKIIISIASILSLILFRILFIKCSNDKKDSYQDKTNNCLSEKIISREFLKATNNENLNISLLLDLSDRIDTTKFPEKSMEYYQRDIGYVESVADAFIMHLLTKKINQMNDKIQLFFDPEPKSKEISKIANHLRFQVDKSSITQELLCNINSVYHELPNKIYKQALSDNDYVGSNTWGFFKNKVNDYCVDDHFRNILVILTDGYIYHEDMIMEEGNLSSYLIPQYIKSKKLNTKDWKNIKEEKGYGFIKATEDLSNLEVLILGINPDKNNPYEEDVIRTFWNDWLTSMNVKHFAIKNADLPSNMDKIIKDFILLKR